MRKAEIAEQSNILDQQIEAWSFLKATGKPFQVVLNKKTRKNSQSNENSFSQAHSKRARTEDITHCSNKFRQRPRPLQWT
ncbi:hypothetical protein TNCV_4037381 [Trichonephila clavipes]|nr:hypothetical protein TNCV_4037381 [Trichonephila clavipes]